MKLGRTERFLVERSKIKPIVAALIDPEDFTVTEAAATSSEAEKCGVSVVLVGGSTISDQHKLDLIVRAVKASVSCPVILFPGNVTGISHHADAILFSSLLNSTNPYFIIGAQALGAMEVRRSKLESIPMGYLVFGDSSATSFIGQTRSFPRSKPSLAVIYAMAAQYLGMRTLYLEGGSGTSDPVPPEVISQVRAYYEGVLIVGGGITDGKTAARAARAGANILVVGNLLQTKGFQSSLRQIVSGSGRSA